MLIGELAQATGLSRDTLRFYERQGLITTLRQPNGYRRFPPGTAEWVGTIRLAQGLGFSLAEIAAVLPQFQNNALDTAQVQALLGERLAALDAHIAQLSRQRQELVQRLAQGCPLRRAAQAAQNTPISRASN